MASEEELENHTRGFVAGVSGKFPYAVRAEEAKNRTGKTARLTDDDLVKTTQAFVVDAPIDPTREPDPDQSGFVAAGAKEGHGTGRRGVALFGLEAPPRAPEGARRPVVALVDSLVRPHPWLGDGGGSDPFWRDARTGPDGWRPFGDLPPELAIGFALMGQDDPRSTHAGHGTFLAGLVRQIAPNSRVLSLPVMHRTGVVDDLLVQSALDWLLDRCRRAHPGHPDLFVDVVNLSFGEYLRGARNVPQESPLLDTIRELGSLGVRVVASAGNRATDNPVIPAAWAPEDSDAERSALVSVGALDPDGDRAVYSNHGDWVQAQAPGTALVSTLPEFDHVPWPDTEFAGAGKGEDPNLQASGFGLWSGTSFAAGWLSATIAKHLLDGGGDQLADVSPDAAKARARTALAAARSDVATLQASRAPG